MGRIVTVQRIIDGLYGEDPPAGVGNAQQSFVDGIHTTTLIGAAVLATGAAVTLFALRGVPAVITDRQDDERNEEVAEIPLPAVG